MPSTRKPKKTQPRMAAEAARQAIQMGTGVIRGLTPATLSRKLDAFDLGYLREAALVWQKIRDRDDTVISVTQKRELDAALLDYEILTLEDSREAKRHKEALEAFYNNCRATHALDQNQRGGVSMLIRQMMHSVGHKYAVHEIVWDPSGADLTAEFRFVPLQFFENTEGRLRFLAALHSASGEEMEEGGWMVTTGPGLMEATSIAYLFKQQPIRAWLILCEKYAVPYLHGETTATYGSEEWNKFRDALAAFVSDGSLVTNAGAKINPIEIQGQNQPAKDLVDRMDRAIARIWRGADLGTISQQGDATGSNPQEDETEILAAADALMISEALQNYVDRMVIRYRFGVEPLAYFHLKPRVRVDQAMQLKIDDALIRWGVPRAKQDLLEEYGRPEPADEAELATAPSGSPLDPAAALGNEAGDEAARQAFLRNSASRLTPAALSVVEPLLRRLGQIADMTDPAAQRAALERFRAALPELARDAMTRVPAAAQILEQIISTALVDGFATSARKKAAQTA